MAKAHLIISFVLIISSLMLIANARILSQERAVRFRFYAHDVLSGPNATVYEVARANITATSPTSFGQVGVADDFITAGPDINSQKLGHAHFLAVSTGLSELSYILTGIFRFTNGTYNGSTLSILGFKLIPNPNQQLPVVGGTGMFSKARGHALSNLQSFDNATNTYVWKYDMYVVI